MCTKSEEAFKKELCDMGYEDVIIYTNPSYLEAFIGVSTDGRAIYDYDLMVQSLIKEGMSEDSAIDWIEYNCVGMQGEGFPIILHSFK